MQVTRSSKPIHRLISFAPCYSMQKVFQNNTLLMLISFLLCSQYLPICFCSITVLKLLIALLTFSHFILLRNLWTSLVFFLLCYTIWVLIDCHHSSDCPCSPFLCLWQLEVYLQGEGDEGTGHDQNCTQYSRLVSLLLLYSSVHISQSFLEIPCLTYAKVPFW